MTGAGLDGATLSTPVYRLEEPADPPRFICIQPDDAMLKVVKRELPQEEQADRQDNALMDHTEADIPAGQALAGNTCSTTEPFHGSCQPLAEGADATVPGEPELLVHEHQSPSRQSKGQPPEIPQSPCGTCHYCSHGRSCCRPRKRFRAKRQ